MGGQQITGAGPMPHPIKAARPRPTAPPCLRTPSMGARRCQAVIAHHPRRPSALMLQAPGQFRAASCGDRRYKIARKRRRNSVRSCRTKDMPTGSVILRGQK